MEAAVVSASHSAMASLLGKLGELLTAKYKLLKESKGQIMFLKAELETMYVFLKKISGTEEPDEQDKYWAKEVRELSYDIEDSVSEFMLRVELESSKPHGFKGFINKSMELLTTMNTRHEIAKEFEGLKILVKEVSERRTRYKMDDVAPKSNDTAIDLRLLALHAETTSLVGVTGPRDQLIQLMDAEGVPAHQLNVLSIVGFGGLGKTTLANEIYRKLEEKFQCQAFVSVSQKQNIKKILRTILSQVGFKPPKDTNIEIWEEPELIM
jgi:shikimate kinase